MRTAIGLASACWLGWGLVLGSARADELDAAYQPFRPELPRTMTAPPMPERAPADEMPAAPAENLEPSAGPAPAPACSCQQPKCDCKKKKELAKKAATAYKPLFYLNDFSYLNDPCYDGCLLGECLKQLHPTCCSTLDLGGQYRARYHHENNMRGLGLTGRDDDFLLHRTRLYGNLKLGDDIRVYGEYIDAVSNYETYAPRTIEENRSDILNLFVDARLLETCDGDLWGRVGRQELLFGNQRYVSPLDWANTRRTFDGARLSWKTDDWDLDAFWTQPVPQGQFKSFDNPVSSQEFLGLYSAYKGVKDQSYEMYFLRYAEYDGPVNFQFNTYGGRVYGTRDNWIWEAESAYQGGEYNGFDHSAWMFVCGIGRKFCTLPWQPTLSLYYDWAEGDNTRGNGHHHLFPLVHAYWGFMDLFGFRNLEDLNLKLEFKPHEKLNCIAWWHVFNLQDGNDVPYAVNMAPSPVPLAVVPGGSQHLGQELDFLVQWKMNARMDLAVGYSHFFVGDWFRTNPTPGLFRRDADFTYVQYTVNF